ncbi:MAG: hypothetical protein WC974_08470 [Thermoplasmata archaeon]
MNFSTTITEKNIGIINYDADDATASDFLIAFEVEFDRRAWGIKTISVYNIKVLSGSVFLTNDEAETEIECSEFKVHEEVEINSGCITVRELEIDIKNKIIKVK